MRTLDKAIAKEKEEAKRLRKIIETGYDGGISIEAIFCDDTDAIKEAYERFENCAKKHEQYAEWLEELKALKNGLNIKCDNLNDALEKGRNIGYCKAIDDFVEKISIEISESIIYGMLVDSRKYNGFNDTSDKIVDYVIETSKNVAEQLKEGESE